MWDRTGSHWSGVGRIVPENMCMVLFSYLSTILTWEERPLASPWGWAKGAAAPNRPWTRFWDSCKSDEKCEHLVGDKYAKDWKSLVWLLLENPLIYRRDDIWRLNGVIYIHDRDPKHKIYVLFFSPRPPQGLRPWTHWALLSPRRPQLCPNLWLLAPPVGMTPCRSRVFSNRVTQCDI